MRLAEVRAAVRAVARAPLIPALIILLATTGLGFALAMWAMVDALYLRPLPFPAADRIVTVFERHPERGRMAVTPANFLDWSPTTVSFSAVSGSQAIDVSLNAGPDSGGERLAGARVLPAYFEVWGLPPLLGRTFTAEDFDTARPVVVVSERVWRLRMRADPGAIGAPIRIDGIPQTVVGVMPAASSSLGHVEIWTPWTMTAEERTERRYHLVGAIGRLGEGRSAAGASAELGTQYAVLARDHPDTTRDWRGGAVLLRDDLLEAPGAAVRSMAAVVALTFGLACLNVGALLAAWWSGRHQELLTRVAVGATRSQLARQLVAESVVVATPGVAGAVLLAHACLRLFSALAAAPAGGFDFQPKLDWRVMAVGFVFLVTFSAATAVVPAVRAAWSATRLAADTRSTRRRGGQWSIAAQVMVALVVTVLAGALVQNVRALTRMVHTGPTRHQAIEIVLPETRYSSEAAQRDFFTRLLAAVRTRPEVAFVSATSYVPPMQAPGNMRFTIEGRPAPSDAQSASPAAVDRDAFRALGTPLVRGRLFDERDGPGMPDVCVISAALARRYWADADPLGQRLHVVGLDRPITVVGVVGDVRQPISTDPRAETVLYLPFAQIPWPFMTVLVEPSGAAADAIAAVTRELARMDDGIAPGAARPLDDLQSDWLRSPRLHAMAISVFGAASLILTLGGIYARMAHRVAGRRREWAVRQALGATPVRLRREMASEVATVTATGALAGLAALPAMSGLVAGLVYGANVLDWPRALIVAAALVVASAAAGDIPSRRAARLELSQVLRHE